MTIHLQYLQLINTDVCKETIRGILLLDTLMNPNHFVFFKILGDFVYNMYIRVVPNFYAFSIHNYSCCHYLYEGRPKCFRNLNLPHKRDVVQGYANRYGEPTIF
jgi:hypothetical protein